MTVQVFIATLTLSACIELSNNTNNTSVGLHNAVKVTTKPPNNAICTSVMVLNRN